MESGRNMSAMNATVNEMELRTSWKSKVVGTSQRWWCRKWNRITHCLGAESGGNTSAIIVLLMIWTYTPTERRKRREHVSHDCASHKMYIRTTWESKVAGTCQTWRCSVAHGIGIRTRWESKVAGTCQPWLCCSWNINTHFLIIDNGRNK